MAICCLLLASRMKLHVFEDKVMESFSSRLGNRLQCLNCLSERIREQTLCTGNAQVVLIFCTEYTTCSGCRNNPPLLFHLFCNSLCIYEPADIKCFAILLCFQQAIE